MSDPASAGRHSAATVSSVRRFVAAADRLPSPRGVALRVLELSRDPDVGIAEIAHVIKGDPSLAGRVIHAANAARFAGKAQVVDVSQAVARLGVNTVKSLSIAVSVVDGGNRPSCRPFDYERFWGHSLFCAIAVSQVASSGMLRGEEAFALGLLSQIGALALATADPDGFASVLEASSARELHTLEQEAYGFDHDALSAVLLTDWGVPQRYTDVVLWRRDPEQGGYGWSSPEYRLATELQMADAMADVCLGGTLRRRDALAWCAKRMHLDPESLCELSQVVISEWSGWSAELGIRCSAPVPLDGMAG